MLTMCHGNCDVCRVKRVVSVNNAVKSVARNAEPPKPVVATIETVVSKATDEPVASPVEETGLALYEPIEQVETYKIAKTRQGFVGKIIGGLA